MAGVGGWLVGWWLAGGWLAVGWRSSPFGPVQSVHTVGPSSRSRRALKAGVGGLTAGGRGRQQEGNSAVAPHHETAKTAPNTQNSRSSSTKTSILCSKCPKTRVLEAKIAQKPRFCARNAPKQGFQRAKAHKNLNFVLKTPENGGFGSQKSTKTPILCSGRRGVVVGRENIGIGSATVAFLQITAHASKMQIPHNQIINF